MSCKTDLNITDVIHYNTTDLKLLVKLQHRPGFPTNLWEIFVNFQFFLNAANKF